MNVQLRSVFTLWMCLCFAACADAVDIDEQHDKAHDDAAEFEGCPESIPKFSLGMSTENDDGSIKVSVLEASPSPPARFLNDWTVKLTGSDDAPRNDVKLSRVRAFMPVHGHYGTPDPKLKEHDEDPNVFDVDKLNLFMRGPWQILLDVNSDDGASQLVFEVCVEE